jgi:hypothetical protein
MPRLQSFLLVSLTLVLPLCPARTAEPDARAIDFFERRIRPVLVEKCYGCHSVQSGKQRGGLSLDSRAGLLTGGENGPALVPGKPAESLLLKAIRHEGERKMPPKEKLPDAIIADLVRWIEMGAPDPRDGKATVQRSRGEESRTHWAFQPSPFNVGPLFVS